MKSDGRMRSEHSYLVKKKQRVCVCERERSADRAEGGRVKRKKRVRVRDKWRERS